MIRHEYETIYVTRPDLSDADQSRIDEKLQGIISDGNGEVLVFETWGRRKLAYNICHHQQGTYQYLHYVAPAELPGELERNMRLEDSLIRFLTVKLDDNVDVEAARDAASTEHERRASRLGLVPEDEPGEGEEAEQADETSKDGATAPSSDTATASEDKED